MLEYFRPITSDGFTYSIDKVVISYHFHPKQVEDFINLVNNVGFSYSCDVKHFQSMKIGTFRYQFVVKFENGNTFWVGCGLNQSRTKWGTVHLEFNPNKLGKEKVLQKILGFANSCCSRISSYVKRFDLAIDFPIEREKCFLIKDNRKYTSYVLSNSNKTEYLGQGSTNNRCKLYNKQQESKLDKPLTRFEITLDYSTKYDDVHIPKVYMVVNNQLNFGMSKMNATDSFIVATLLTDMSNFNLLERRKRNQIDELLKDYTRTISISEETFQIMKNQVKDFFKYPICNLDEFNELDEAVDVDYLEPYLAKYKKMAENGEFRLDDYVEEDTSLENIEGFFDRGED